MSSKRGIKNPKTKRTRRVGKVSDHTVADRARVKARMNITISEETRAQLGDLGPLSTVAGVVGQASSNFETGIDILHFANCGGNADELAFTLIELAKDVARHKGEASVLARIKGVGERLGELKAALDKVLASQVDAGNGRVVLTKGKAGQA